LILAEKLRATVEQAEYARLASVTGSFGLAIMPDHAVDVELLIREADRALYRAKARGRNRVEAAASGNLDIATPITDLEQVVGSPIDRRAVPFSRDVVRPLGTTPGGGDFWPKLPA
jgi:hypothetical protein